MVGAVWWLGGGLVVAWWWLGGGLVVAWWWLGGAVGVGWGGGAWWRSDRGVWLRVELDGFGWCLFWGRVIDLVTLFRLLATLTALHAPRRDENAAPRFVSLV